MPESFEAARRVLTQAVADRAFPAAVVEVGTRLDVMWREAFGRVSSEPHAAVCPDDALFDLASLTKVIVTATVAMQSSEANRFALDDRVAARLPAWRGEDRASVTMVDLLEHASGLTAYLPFYVDHVGRSEYEPAICSLPLEYSPRSRSVYSDLGFMLLGFILADAGEAPLDVQFAPVAEALGAPDLLFRPGRRWRGTIVPTEVDSWRGRLLVGDVHDENAWALGGVAGHAGLFGTVAGVGTFARSLLKTLAGEPGLVSQKTLRRFLQPSSVPGSSRALAWDTMRPTSSCGSRIARSAFGHTGFTGTSLWIDPEREIYIVMLTNRVHPTRENEAIIPVRRALHDAVIESIDRRRAARRIAAESPPLEP